MRELSREIRFESLDALDRSAVSRSESQQNLKVCGEGKAGDLTDLTGCFSFVSDVSVRLADCLSSERNASRGSLEEDYKKSLSDKDTTIRAVETLIQYRFRNAALLWEALQVPGSGTVGAGKTKPADGNKRLAIVGDAALRLALAEDWYPGGTPKANFCKIVSGVASNKDLDRMGQDVGLGEFVRGTRGKRTVADTVEAVLGAVFLDGRLKVVRNVMDRLDLVSRGGRSERMVKSEDLGFFGGGELERPSLSRKRKRSRS